MNLAQDLRQDSAAMLFREKMPNTFRLALEAGARNHVLLKQEAMPTSLVVRLVAYRLSWDRYVNSAHKDGHAAIHIPLLREGCSATTVFRNSQGEEATVSVSGTDMACFTDDALYHQVVVSQTEPVCESPKRVVMNVMTTYHMRE